MTLDAKTGSILDSTGSDIFYMPHGMTIDRNGNMWITDVALHQVFKFMPNHEYPTITLGHRFEPGTSKGHLCKPTCMYTESAPQLLIKH